VVRTKEDVMTTSNERPTPDLSALFDRHVGAEFVHGDAGATMDTMTQDPVVVHVPVLTGGRGHDQLLAFYRDQFIPSWPDDVVLEPLSRTVGENRVVDEFVLRFTHSQEMPFWLPGVAPSGRVVALPVVVIMSFAGDRVSCEHIYWDQASLLRQIGLLEAGDLPIAGAEQASALVDPTTPLNALIDERS
jgi:carboxymethylenebutenolidase